MSLYLIRHGETAWSISGQHTGRTDIPLTAQGEQQARTLAEKLRAVAFSRVFTSPTQRARRTCELVGLDAATEIEPIAAFSHGHFGRVLAARWIGLSVRHAQRFLLSTASLSVLGYEQNAADESAIALWNAVSNHADSGPDLQGRENETTAHT